MAEKKTARKKATGGKAGTTAAKAKKTAKTVKSTTKKTTKKAAAATKKTAKTAGGRRTSRSGPGVSIEQRQQMVAEAAYLRAERHGFEGDPTEHWLAAESEIKGR